MSFSDSNRTLKSGETHNQTIHAEMSVNAENVANASDAEKSNPSNERISLELIEEKLERIWNP